MLEFDQADKLIGFEERFQGRRLSDGEKGHLLQTVAIKATAIQAGCPVESVVQNIEQSKGVQVQPMVKAHLGMGRENERN